MRRLVLVGAGHAHARVLKDFATHRVPDLEIVLVSPTALAPYSGMAPGWLAGHYQWQECCIDFIGLCECAGVTLMIDSVVSVDAASNMLGLADGGAIRYDWLSLNIGSTLEPPASAGNAVLPLRPLSALPTRWDGLLASVRVLPAKTVVQVAMVGGGAAGVESILAAHQRLTRIAPQVDFRFVLMTQGPELLSALPPGATGEVREELDTRNIRTMPNFSVAGIDSTQGNAVSLVGKDGRTVSADIVLWATGAQANRWPGDGGIATDSKGFVRVDRHLRSVSHANLFAVGDCARLHEDLPKAGVFAVRMGPILSQNLLAVMTGKALKQYVPQRRYLMIIGTGGEDAIAVWGRFFIRGKWVWRWKQKIDRRFVDFYNHSDSKKPSPSA